MELRIDRLTKRYGSKIAVDRMEYTLKAGVYGLLGANGAGKTSLMRMLCGINRPTSGQIYYDGQPIEDMGEQYRCILGYLPQNFGYYPEFTAFKFLMYMSSLKGLSKTAAVTKSMELLETTGLMDVKDKKIRTFSGGMKQRLGIAQAMLNDPKILILDEPTSGLDPKERVKFRNLLSSFSNDKIVLLSTHIVSDIEYIANEILVMKAGQLIHRGSPERVTEEVSGYVWECRVPEQQVHQWTERYVIGNLRNEGNNAVLRVIAKEKPALDAVPVKPNLEDLYLYYFNEEDGYGTTGTI